MPQLDGVPLTGGWPMAGRQDRDESVWDIAKTVASLALILDHPAAAYTTVTALTLIPPRAAKLV
jgi:hypothetical protein